jgi:hypothetical protein
MAEPTTDPQPLTIVIMCNDERGDTLVGLLQPKVANLYLLKSGGCRQFTPTDPVGLSMPRHQVPLAADALLFHSVDRKHWDDLPLQPTLVFEFNTPGTPLPKTGVLPVYRQTFPHVAITPGDIDELLDYIAHPQAILPRICQPLPTLDLLPALHLLCQWVLHPPSGQIEDNGCAPHWWLKKLGLLTPAGVDQPACQRLFAQYPQEGGQPEQADPPHPGIHRLLTHLLPIRDDGYVLGADSVPLDIVQAADRDLQQRLGDTKPQEMDEPADDREDIHAILSVQVSTPQGSFLTTTAAALLAEQLGIVHHALALASDALIVSPDYQKSPLLLSDRQITCLPTLRKHGFAGAVLVLSPSSFAILKQNHRVLRFGQGSHDALIIPFRLEDLRAKLETLVPMEPQNLRFLQDELTAIKELYDREILPCLESLEQSNDDRALAEVSTLLEKLRSKTPVACHTLVTIGEDTQQIQHHLRQALQQLQQSPDDQSRNYNYLKAAFAQWHDLVQSTAGEQLNLNCAS